MPRGSCGFGIVRSIDVTRGRTRLAELCEILSREMGTLFIPHHPESYGGLIEAFESGVVSVAWLPPLACIRLEDARKATVLALPVRRGAVSYRAALITHATQANAPRSVSDLAGKRVAWVDRESSSGYYVPRLFLQSAGVLLSGFAEERFVGSHANVVAAVTGGRVDVGATYCALGAAAGESGSFAPAVPDGQPPPPLPRGPWTTEGASPPPLRLLATTGAIPNDALVVSSSLPADLRLSLLRWVLNLGAGRAQQLCAELFGADAFQVSSPAHFDPLRRLVSVARSRG
jgi:phosphonate transport system substrate-binding protein